MEPDLTTPERALDASLAARERIRQHVHETPLLECRSLSLRAQTGLLLKCENLQRGGAFKIRGALTKILSLSAPERDRGLVAHSSGNHAQGVALAAAIVGARAVVVMPEDATPAKVAATRGYGATVVFAGTTSEERAAESTRLCEKHGYTLVPPFDDPFIIVGQGTVALEAFDQCPEVAVVFAPIGGGGLIAGTALITRARSPRTRVIGVEPVAQAKVQASRAQGTRVSVAAAHTVADGLRPLAVGVRNWDVIRRTVDDVVTVTDDEILGAVRLLIERAKLVVEPSGAASVAAALREGRRYPGPAVAIVSGGNISAEALAAAMATEV